MLWFLALALGCELDEWLSRSGPISGYHVICVEDLVEDVASVYRQGVASERREAGPVGDLPAFRGAVEKAGAPIPKGGTVLLCTGHHARTFPTPAYSTDNPGVNPESTGWLAGQGVVSFGIDSMRPGPEGDTNALVHKACHELGITHMEGLCKLEKLIGAGHFRFVGLPLKIRGGTGSPIRAVAVLEE